MKDEKKIKSINVVETFKCIFLFIFYYNFLKNYKRIKGNFIHFNFILFN